MLAVLLALLFSVGAIAMLSCACDKEPVTSVTSTTADPSMPDPSSTTGELIPDPVDPSELERFEAFVTQFDTVTKMIALQSIRTNF